MSPLGERLGAEDAAKVGVLEAAAHLWINDPLKPGLMARLFSTHPPIPERVSRLEQMGGTF